MEQRIYVVSEEIVTLGYRGVNSYVWKGVFHFAEDCYCIQYCIPVQYRLFSFYTCTVWKCTGAASRGKLKARICFTWNISVYMAKLTRSQIKEGLDQVPIDTLLLGVVDRKETKLTPKQREFARQVALGETKANAYRKAYNAKGKPKGVANNGHALSRHTGVQLEIEAYRLAAEAEKQRSPAQLRALVIHQLTKHALDEDCPPAQRIKALELLGKVSEVAAFTERKETTVINHSGDLKQKLLDQLRNVVDITPNAPSNSGQDDADSLLAELSAAPDSPGEIESEIAVTHPPATPLDGHSDQPKYTHTIPHTRNHPESIPHNQTHPDSDGPLPSSFGGDETPTPSIWEDPPIGEGEEMGEGGIYFEKSKF